MTVTDKFKGISAFILKLKQNEKLIFLWDVVFIGIVGMNSFIILFHHNWNNEISSMHIDPMTKVIGAATLSYLIIFIVQVTILMRKKIYATRRAMLYTTRKVFRLVYTLVCLVIIMIKQIELGIFDSENLPPAVVVQSAAMFMGTLILGTTSLWSGKLFLLAKKSYPPLNRFWKEKKQCLVNSIKKK